MYPSAEEVYTMSTHIIPRPPLWPFCKSDHFYHILLVSKWLYRLDIRWPVYTSFVLKKMQSPNVYISRPLMNNYSFFTVRSSSLSIPHFSRAHVLEPKIWKVMLLRDINPALTDPTMELFSYHRTVWILLANPLVKPLAWPILSERWFTEAQWNCLVIGNLPKKEQNASQWQEFCLS